jgi:uncharacterized membrane protein YgdD (TMEM256/DUF423 family)
MGGARLWIAGVVGFLAVALGAFGAHGLEGRLTPERLQTWHTAVLYHLVHAPALLALALHAPAGRALRVAWGAWLGGVAVFSGSLYALALTDLRWLGAVTPVGGVLLLAGWAAVVSAGRRGRPSGS